MKLFDIKQPYFSELDSTGGTEDVAFDDATELDDSSLTEGEETTPPTEEAEEPTQPEPYKFKIKYNHEEREMAEDEAIPLIQKGMNFDKLQEKFNDIQNDPRFGKFEKISQVSQLLGYQTDDELIEALYDTYYESTAQSQGLTPEQIRKDYELQQREKQIEQKNQTIAQTQNSNAMYDRFLQAFPDVTAESIKPETWEKVNQGMDLTTAYTLQRNQELETEMKTLKQNSENQKKAPVGSLTAMGGESEKHDDFLEGLLGGI